MDSAQVQQLRLGLAAAYASGADELIETHISWVILAGPYAYKIKKPVRFDFLDFSSLEQRRFYCQRELELNRRLAGEFYLGVVPIVQSAQGPLLDMEGKIIDYAVKMKRMDSTRQMNLLLEEGRVAPADMRQLADMLASFHRQASRVKKAPDIARFKHDFANLESVAPYLAENLGPSAAKTLRSSISFAQNFLSRHAACFQKRSNQGYVIDGHGDLHSHNIFLLDKPVIFDCIEFNDYFRQVDVLDEVAFLCMDLNYFHCQHLEAPFLQAYFQQNPCIACDEDWLLFAYYQWYRANVRLKVSALQEQAGLPPGRSDALERYWALYVAYYELLKKQMQPAC
jgi:uncharacterized protein